MIRKLALAVLLTLWGVPLSVLGIGLGELKTYSALNQNFRGEIRLLSVPQGELDTMRVKLASQDAFAKAGAEYLHMLTQLKFEPVRRKDGSAVILVTSSNAIREPFLDFLVEMNWPNGRLFREYTVLLDPPLTTRRRSGEISKPKIIREKRTVAVAPAAPAKPAVVKQESQPSSANTDTYGPVAANETLWKVAGKVNPQSYSHHQMMMAMFRKNPDAFVNTDINQLKKGSMLKVPDANEIKALNRKEAIALFNQQANYQSVDIAETADTPAIAEAAMETDVAEPQPVEYAEDARLQIAAASPDGEGEAGASESGTADDASEASLRQQLMLARENIETSRLETDELKTTVSEMASQLEEMRRLLTIQDEQLAQLRATVMNEEDAPLGSAETLANESSAEAQAESALLADQEGESADVAAVSDSEAGELTTSGDHETNEVTGSGETAPAELVAATDDAPTEVMANPEPAPAETMAATEPEPAVVAEESVKTVADNNELISWLQDNLVMLATSAGGLFGIGALVALFRGNRRKKQQDEEFADLSEEMLVDTQGYRVGESSDAAAIHEETLPSEPSTNGTQTLEEDTTEVDPIAAADVYIAYDRFAEAQNVLEEAIDSGNDSLPIHHKLLEIYSTTQNKEEFSALAERMAQDGLDKQDSTGWERVKEMGKKLDRFNPLFWTSATASVAAAETESTTDLDFDAIEGLDSAEAKAGDSLGAMDNLKLDLSSFGMDDIDESEDISGLTAGAGEREEEITFAEPIADIEIGDEMDTKLELARAYVDMGDNEGAMSILKEVLENGTGDQITAASELVSQLNS